ncbi:MAG: serine hydrolase, partial [Planctomycetota bacterium]
MIKPARVLMYLLSFLLFLLPANAGDLASELGPIIEAHKGKVAVQIRQLETGEEFAWRATEVQPTASLIKLPVMVTAYRMADRNGLDLKKMLTLTEADKVPGSGVLTDHFTAGMSVSLRDTIRLMIRYSDNTATNMVVDQLGLPATDAEMKELTFSETRLNSKVYRGDTTIDPDRSKLYGLGSTTARETVDLLDRLHKGTIASPDSCKAMIDHLLACEDNSMISRDLPVGTKIAHKTGAVSASRCDAGIIYSPKGPIAICVLTTDNADRQWTDENSAQRLMGRIARIAFDHFNPEWERKSADVASELGIGAFGPRVEMLQRTLNTRLQPSPNLGVDGDFGPATEAAVKQFQASRHMETTGVATSEFWSALGPVIEEIPVPEPNVVNSETLPTAPPEPLGGAPVVSADAWTIIEGSDGRVLASHQADMKTHCASTTKMMTAWLVIHAAEKSPSILEEMVIMSMRADETRGSTADIREGETLSVREAQYGLMLPSGNDMSVALAEHFGSRIGPGGALMHTSADSTTDPLLLFVNA